MDNHSNDLENKKISHTIFIFPIFMVLIMSLVKLIELKTNTNFAFLGVFPKNIRFQEALGDFLEAFINKLGSDDLKRISRAITADKKKIQSMIRDLRLATSTETHLNTFINCMMTLAKNDGDFLSRLNQAALELHMSGDKNLFANNLLEGLQKINPRK